MTITKSLIKIYRGDTYDIELSAIEDDGTTVLDLTGYTMTFEVRIGDSVADISEDFACSTDPTLGIAYGTLTSLITDIDVKTYDYYVTVENTDTPPIVRTIAKGKLKILKGITI
jgi:hypothetical protein